MWVRKMTTTFKRVEEKYLLNKTNKDLLFKKIDKYIKKDDYYKSTICSIYFDNDNNDMIINSIEKPKYKDKVRLRSYNVPKLDDIVYLEIKNKYKGIVGKRRVKFTLKDYYNYIDKGIYDNNSQIMKEINYLINYYNIKPKIFIGYDRLSYKGIDDNNLRITIDSNLRSRRNELKIELGDYGDKYFDEDYYIMEIKTMGSIPLWFVKILSELKIYPTSFSKYGNIYKKYLKGDDKYVK